MTAEEKRERRRVRDRAWAKANPELKRARHKAWAESNPERKRINAKTWREANLERTKATAKAWRKANRESIRMGKKTWREANRERVRAQGRTRNKYRKEIDPSFKILSNLRTRLYSFFKGQGRSATTKELLQCDLEWLLIWLEAGFKPGMTLENYGEWHIDHIRPLTSFEKLATDPAQQRAAFHWANLQPLWAHENFSKRNRLFVER